MPRKAKKEIKLNLPEEVLYKSRRRCAICFGLKGDKAQKKGQIAHLDQNRENDTFDNLAFLCLEHHDEYDTKTSQSKSLQINEVKKYREELYDYNQKFFEQQTQVGSERVGTESKMELCTFVMAGFKDRTILLGVSERPKAVRLISPVEQLITQPQLPCDVDLKHSYPAKLTLHEFIECGGFGGLLISESSDTCGIVVDMEIYYAWPAS